MERVTAAHPVLLGRISPLLNPKTSGKVLSSSQHLQTMSSDAEYIILENIYDSSSQKEPIRQRDLAQIAGASLGMTNSILKRLAEKGWITIKKLNSRKIQYAITIEGINEIIHRSYRYFKGTIRNVVYFREILEKLMLNASQKNIHTVMLVGNSDLDFIVEHACNRHGLRFQKAPNADVSRDSKHSNTLKIYSENLNESPRDAEHGDGITLSLNAENQFNSFYLSRLIMLQKPR